MHVTLQIIISIVSIVDTNPRNVIDPSQSVSFTVPIGTPCQVVTWTEPTAVDDSGVPPTVLQSHRSGVYFPVGVTQVDYIFTYPSGNEALVHSILRHLLLVLMIRYCKDNAKLALLNCPFYVPNVLNVHTTFLNVILVKLIQHTFCAIRKSCNLPYTYRYFVDNFLLKF